jgi:RimJ/RimL family protein N-acetyltransferase
MQDPTLLAATASEPLTIDEEIAMQETWRDDDTKCTFIILARDLAMPSNLSLSSSPSSSSPSSNDVANSGGCLRNNNEGILSIPPPPTTKCQSIQGDNCNEESDTYPLLIEQTLHAMIGDINLFLSEMEEDDESEEGSQSNENNIMEASLHTSQSSSTTNRSFLRQQQQQQAELDIMIASPTHRSKNIGTEATLLMMHYAASHLHIRRFFVKIQKSNLPSLHLFRDKLQFEQVGYVECFEEYELECKCDTWEEMVHWVERRWSRLCRQQKEIGVGNGCDKVDNEDCRNVDGGDDDEVHCGIYTVHRCPC